MSDANAGLDAVLASLTAALPGRFVQRGLVDPAAAEREQLLAGLVCVVSRGGGQFANYLGREGQLGTMEVALVCFLVVDEATQTVAIEQAELALLQDLLAWTSYPNGVGSALPKEFRQSEQLEHPYGWLVLGLDVRF
jgi:hypothetical protein